MFSANAAAIKQSPEQDSDTRSLPLDPTITSPDSNSTSASNNHLKMPSNASPDFALPEVGLSLHMDETQNDRRLPNPQQDLARHHDVRYLSRSDMTNQSNASPQESDLKSNDNFKRQLPFPVVNAEPHQTNNSNNTMWLPEIHIDYAPPSKNLSFQSPLYPIDIDSLMPPDRVAALRRKQSELNPFYSTSIWAQNEGRAQSEQLDQNNQQGSSANYPDHTSYPKVPSKSNDNHNGDWNVNGVQKLSAKFQCTLCPRRFSRAYNLRSHLRTHSEERSFICCICGKAFACQDDKKRHEDLHNSEKNYVCAGVLMNKERWGCGRQFAGPDSLERHFTSEAGRVCIRKLLEEEEEVSRRTGSGYDVNSTHVSMKTAKPFALPAALLEQYPALRPPPISCDSQSIAAKELHGEHVVMGKLVQPIEVVRDHTEYRSETQGYGSASGSVNPQSWKDAHHDAFAFDTIMEDRDNLGLENTVGIRNLSQVLLLPTAILLDSNRLAPKNVSQEDIHSGLAPIDSNRMDLATFIEEGNGVSSIRASSDSGYHSSHGTDAESVCSMGSVGSSLGLPQDFLQNFISFYGDMLIQKSGARMWAGYASAHHSSNEIQMQVNMLLKEYTMELASKPPSSWVSESKEQTQQVLDSAQSQILAGAAKLVRRYRPMIAQYFCDNAGSQPLSMGSLSTRLQDLSQQLSLTEKLGLFVKSSTNNKDPTEAVSSFQMDEDILEAGEEGELLTDLESIRALLISNDSFHRLALRLRRTLYRDDDFELEKIPGCVWLQAHGAKFDIYWNVADFMRSQYGHDFPTVASVVVLTGSALYAQATTCAEYVKTTWPKTGLFLNDLIDSALRELRTSPRDQTVFEVSEDCSYLPLRVEIMIDLSGKLTFTVYGADTLIVGVTQQIAWMGSALSVSPFGDQLAYARPIIHQKSLAGHFKIEIEHRPLHETEAACWLPLFSGAAIASGFPIPDRADETGLEIPLELLAGIAGVRHAVEYEGGVVMKGFSHMLFPVRKKDDRVQWHAISSQDPETRLSYRDALSRCEARASTEEVSLSDIQSCRAIVGWCSVATSRLGSDLANYNNIDYSGAPDADSKIRCAGGSLGVQQFGVASLDFRFGAKEGKCHFQRSGPYQRIVSAAEKTPVVLYDTGERRAWLVPASSVMLHMVQHRHRLEPFEVDGKRITLDTDVSVDSSAKKVLLNNESLRLSDSDGYTFKDAIVNMWSLLEFLVDQSVTTDRTAPDTAIKGTLRDFLCGFEFKAVVEERSPLRQKQTLLNKTNGGWPQLVRDIDALVLLADGFEDIILPADQENQGLCRLWQRVPKGRDYLATSTKLLKELYDVAGCRLNRKYLTSTHLQWHQGNPVLLDSRDYPTACRCNPLQQIFPKSAVGTIVPPSHIVDQGAVIFGHSGSMMEHLIRKPPVQAPRLTGLFSQPNISLMPSTTRNDSDDFTFSDNYVSDQSGPSDSTAESTPGSLSSSTTLSTQDSISEMHTADTSTDSIEPSRKRCRFIGTFDILSEEDMEDYDASLGLAHKRTKGIPVYDSPYLLPPPALRSNYENASRGHRDRSGPLVKGDKWTWDSAGLLSDCAREATLASVFVCGNKNREEEEKVLSSGSLPVRLGDEEPLRVLRRQQGFVRENATDNNKAGG